MIDNKIKNILISFFVGYLTLDIVGSYTLSKTNPSCIKLFLGNLKDTKHIVLLVSVLIITGVVYKLLERNDEN